MGKGKLVEFTTRLETRQCADAFRELMTSARSGFGRVIGGVTFAPPDSSDDPFDALEERPVFEVVAHCPRNRFNKYGGYGIHLYVYEDGDRRRVHLGHRAVGFADVPSANGTLQKVLDGFRQLDASMQVVSG